jgi:hypothetical protein
MGDKEELLNLFKGLGMSEAKAAETIKNASLTNNLKRCIDEVSNLCACRLTHCLFGSGIASSSSCHSKVHTLNGTWVVGHIVELGLSICILCNLQYQKLTGKSVPEDTKVSKLIIVLASKVKQSSEKFIPFIVGHIVKGNIDLEVRLLGQYKIIYLPTH